MAQYNEFSVEDALKGAEEICRNESLSLCAAYSYFLLGFGLLGFEANKDQVEKLKKNKKKELNYAWNWNDRPYGNAYIGSCADIGGDEWVMFNRKMSEYGYSLLLTDFVCGSAAENPANKNVGYPGGYSPQDGDFCAMCTYTEINGKKERDTSGSYHMCIYLGGAWYSDYKQGKMIPYGSERYYPMVYSIWRLGGDVLTIKGNSADKLTMESLMAGIPDQYREEFEAVPERKIKKASSCGGKAEKLSDILIQNGLTPYQACALTVCAMQESSCNHTLRNDREYNGAQNTIETAHGWGCGEGLIQITHWSNKSKNIKKYNQHHKIKTKLPETEEEYMSEDSLHIVDLTLEEAAISTMIFYEDLIKSTKDCDNYIDLGAKFYLRKAGGNLNASDPFKTAYDRAEVYRKNNMASYPNNTYYNGFLVLLKSMFYLAVNNDLPATLPSTGSGNTDTPSGRTRKRKSSDGIAVGNSFNKSALSNYKPGGNYSDDETGRQNRLKDFFEMSQTLGKAYGNGRDIMSVKSETLLVDTPLVTKDDSLSKISSTKSPTFVRGR